MAPTISATHVPLIRTNKSEPQKIRNSFKIRLSNGGVRNRELEIFLSY